MHQPDFCPAIVLSSPPTLFLVRVLSGTNEYPFLWRDRGTVNFAALKIVIHNSGTEGDKSFQQRVEEFFWRGKVQNRLPRS